MVNWKVSEPRIQKESFNLMPKFPYVIFGDGMVAELLYPMKINVLDEEGIPFDQLLLRPTSSLAVKYGLSGYLLGTNNTIIREYWSSHIIKNPNPVNGVWFVLCDFLGHDTELTKIHEKLLRENLYLQMMNADLRSVVSYLLSQEKALLEHSTELSNNIKRLVQNYRGVNADNSGGVIDERQ